ncbi:MAG: hypothetical protein PHV37_10105 [Candidatus Gastranaerophilales bacterium]|nr:hypothetical protein [Candidatus Gastranaerophilales bacterium]
MRGKSNIVKTLKAMILGLACVCITNLAAMAADNTISNVEIKNGDNGYQIVLKADKSTDVRKIVESENDISLIVKGLLPSDSIGTTYNNVPDVDNVMIQPEGDDSTRITIQGKNISANTVSFVPVALAQTTSKKLNTEKSIELGRPVDSYAPIYNQNENFDDVEPNGLFETAMSMAAGSVLAAKPVLGSIFRYVFGLNKKILAMGALFLLIIAFGLKLLKSSSKEEEMKIGLAQSLKSREMDMREQLSLASQAPTLRNQALGDRVVQNNTPSINYGLKAYQNSQRNPYTSQITGLSSRKPLRASAPTKKVQPPIQKPAYKAPQRLTNAQRMELAKKLQMQGGAKHLNSQKVAQKPAMAQPIKPEPLKAIGGTRNVDSLKFLESMSRIYEKNGRADLAQELKSNLQRVQANG